MSPRRLRALGAGIAVMTLAASITIGAPLATAEDGLPRNQVSGDGSGAQKEKEKENSKDPSTDDETEAGVSGGKPDHAGGGKPEHASEGNNGNDKPRVLVKAPPVHVNEGQEWEAQGSFSVPDGVTLELTNSPDVGDFIGNKDGTWTWSGSAADDFNGTFVVTASTEKHSAQDRFPVVIHNVAPKLKKEMGGDPFGCSVTVNVTASDVPADQPTLTGVGRFTHKFVDAGGYWIPGNSVKDKDGGVDASQDEPHTVYNEGVLSPLPSIAKAGSAIPVKLRVTNCEVAPVPGLSLELTATSGAWSTTETMRYSPTDMQYIWPLKTPKGVSGDMTITITHDSISPAVTGKVSLR
jgi:hypothetical protein